jgi:hypothetical protein
MDAKFIQITGAGANVYALDEQGKVWLFVGVNNKWRLMTSERERQG